MCECTCICRSRSQMTTPTALPSQRKPPAPPQPDYNVRRRSFRQWLVGVYPLRCGCVIKYGETCEHGWMVRINGV